MNLNKENMKKIILIGIIFILFYTGIAHLEELFKGILWVISLIFPFIFGVCIAFIINVPMRSIENGLFGSYRGKREKLIKKIKRPVSFILTLLLLLSIIAIVVLFVAPQLMDTISSIIEAIPATITNVQIWLNDLFTEYQWLADQLGDISIDWASVTTHLTDILKNGVGSIFNSTVGIASSIVNGVVTFFFGFFFAIYILFQKESLGRHCKKVLYAYLPEQKVDRGIEILSLSNKTFSKFLSGQCLEALILGTMFFVILTLFRLPYALLIGVLIAFTALIPIVGAFIGCVIGALLMLMVSPTDMIVFIITFLVLQQIEGNLIYPKVVGNSIGLPAIWVLAAITVGGNLMGVAGMLIFIPLVSILYTLLRQATNARLHARKISSKKY